MGTRLFVGNLSYGVTEQDLKEAFTNEGVVVRSVKIALDRESGRPRGFAFVETETEDGAKTSVEKLRGQVVQGRPLVIEEAQARPAPGAPRPGGGFGGPPRPGGFGPPGGGPGGPPRPGFGGPPRPGGFGPPGGGPGGPPRPGFGGPRPGGADMGAAGGPRNFGPPRLPGPERRDRPEKKKSTRPKPEERERGNWRWNGKIDEDE